MINNAKTLINLKTDISLNEYSIFNYLFIYHKQIYAWAGAFNVKILKTK